MTIYTVLSGDTVFSISTAFGVPVADVQSANGFTDETQLVVGQAVIIPINITPRGTLKVNGYTYPHIDTETFASTAPYLTYTAIFSYGVTTTGALVELDDENVLAMARAGGVAPLMLITTITPEGTFSSETATQVLMDEGVQALIIENILATMQQKGYFGLDVDFEYIPPEQRENYIAFVQRIKDALAPFGYPLLIALAPKTSVDQPGLLYEAHDYAALGAIADMVLVMTYEWGHTYGPPMAVAPLPEVEQVLRFAVTQIPPEKILMGIPNYGYDWTLPFVRGTPARSVGNEGALDIARAVGAEIVFDARAQSPYFNYTAEDGAQHVVWFEDARSIQAKLDLLRELKLIGASIWNIMKFFQPTLTLLEGNFHIERIETGANSL